jgi:hypothetical protein
MNANHQRRPRGLAKLCDATDAINRNRDLTAGCTSRPAEPEGLRTCVHLGTHAIGDTCMHTALMMPCPDELLTSHLPQKLQGMYVHVQVYAFGAAGPQGGVAVSEPRTSFVCQCMLQVM